jgi:signal transduction histidine kinase
LKSEHATFFIYDKDAHHVTLGTAKHTKLPTADARKLDEYVSQNGFNIVITEKVKNSNFIKRLLISHKISMLLPLVHENRVLGYFILGDHRRAGYTRRDIQMLETIDDELTIAIQNALSVQEVKDLNAHLEQRIDAATKELRASNAQLQKLDEAKDEFISMASHQLRTPLTSIKGYVSMLMDGDVGEVSKEQKHLLQEAFMSSERMVRLIGDFLNVSRLQTGKFVIEVEGLETNAQSRGLKFTFKRPKNIPELNLDENKIQQVIMNFCDNAIYYSKENSKIQVNLAVVDNQVEFTVTDTGIGVPAGEQEQLFNKFFRATNARKQRPDGTGVGLFLAKKVIDAHDGKIIFESREGKGSTFGFRLPIRTK